MQSTSAKWKSNSNLGFELWKPKSPHLTSCSTFSRICKKTKCYWLASLLKTKHETWFYKCLSIHKRYPIHIFVGWSMDCLLALNNFLSICLSVISPFLMLCLLFFHLFIMLCFFYLFFMLRPHLVHSQSLKQRVDVVLNLCCLDFVVGLQ